MLRAVRFAATFEFQIEPATLHAIQELAGEINTVSAERIGMEIRRMLTNSHSARALDLLRDTGLFPQVFPEIAALSEIGFDETKRILSALHEPPLPLALAALLVMAVQSDGNQTSCPSLTTRRSPLANALGRRLKYTNKEIERTAWLLANRPAIVSATQLPWPQLQRVLTHDGAAELLALQQAIAGPDDPALAFCRERLAWPAEKLNPPPLVDGGDLIQHGLRPGPSFTSLLEQVRDAQLNGEINSRDEALALVDRLR
jgi:tRNA nucleotidyltransferase/poly(A) polymerase